MLSFITSQNLPLVIASIVAIIVFASTIALLLYVVRKLPSGTIAKDVATVETDVATALNKVESTVAAKLTFMQKIPDRLRMMIWLFLGLAAYVASFIVGPSQPVIQTTLYKVGHVTTLAWVGYWISRKTIGRITPTSTPHDRIARALMIGAVIVAGSLGL